jgi:hypothetical protein
MPVSRRSFLKQLGALGALALISPTGAIEAIVPKEHWGTVKGQELAEQLVKYCHSMPQGHVGRSVCGVETIISETTFGRLVRGLSVGRDKRSMKYWTFQYDDLLVLEGKAFEQFCNDAMLQLKIAWKHDKRYNKWSKPWGTAPPTMTQKEAHRRVHHISLGGENGKGKRRT